MHLLVVLLILLIGLGNVSDVLGRDSYGPYDLYFTKVEECRGPKAKNLTEAIFRLKKAGNIFLLSANITFKEKTKIETMKMFLTYSKNNSQYEVARYQEQNPCRHHLLSLVLACIFDINDSCTVKPGIYTRDLDVAKFTKKLYKSLLYGDFSHKIVAYSRKGNIGCIKSRLRIIPV